MLTRTPLRLGLLLLALGIFAVPTLMARPSELPAYGRTLIAQYQLPREAIERYAALAAGASVGESRGDGSRFADLLPWVGPQQRAGDGHNPYTLVLTVDGMAQAAGEVLAQWQIGWEIQEESAAERREVVMDVLGLVGTALRDRQSVTLTASSGPLSFRGERTVAPKLGVVHLRNLDVTGVRLQVWSGIAPLAWPTMPAWSELPTLSKTILALCMACLLCGTALRLWPHRAGGQAALPSPSAYRGKTSAPAGSRAATVLRPKAPLAVAVLAKAPPVAVVVACALVPDHQACVLANLERVLQGRSATRAIRGTRGRATRGGRRARGTLGRRSAQIRPP